MNKIKFNSLIPELSVLDINKSKEFYQKLGFIIKYERKEDKFCFLELEDNQIMIEEINNHWDTGKMEYPFGRGINISMDVTDVEALYQKVQREDLKQSESEVSFILLYCFSPSTERTSWSLLP